MRSASTSSASILRARTPGVVALAHDLKSLIVRSSFTTRNLILTQ